MNKNWNGSKYASEGIYQINLWKQTYNNNSQLTDNKAKGHISKRVLKENKAYQIFRKTNISYSLMNVIFPGGRILTL